MILPSGSIAISVDTKGKALLVVTKEDDVKLYVDDPMSIEPIILEFGNGQAAIDELIANIRKVEVFSGD